MALNATSIRPWGKKSPTPALRPGKKLSSFRYLINRRTRFDHESPRPGFAAILHFPNTVLMNQNDTILLHTNRKLSDNNNIIFISIC